MILQIFPLLTWACREKFLQILDSMRFSLVLLWTLTVLCVSDGLVENDLIEDLPGVNFPVEFKQYAGYVTVGSGVNSSSSLFYWLVESQSSNPLKDPLILWLNGGPGCSSLLGLLTEHGPFKVNEDGVTLSQNAYSWNRNANVVYLETPAGVGFSYGGSKKTGDNVTCIDNYNFLQGFFEKHPRYVHRELYISGESHAGVYIPMLAKSIVEHNSMRETPEKRKINLKGFFVGNPSGLAPSKYEDGYVNFVRNHGFIDNSQYDSIAEVCQSGKTPRECAASMLKLTEKNLYGIDPYNIYRPCDGPGPALHGGCAVAQSFMQGESMPYAPRNSVETVVPCTDFSAIEHYLNQKDVRKALHVPNALANTTWAICGTSLRWEYPYNKSLIPKIYKEFGEKHKDIRILVFSGDVDSCVPFIGTRGGVRDLGFQTVGNYRKWMVNDQNGLAQIAGYTQSYEPSITFATVRGAGHMVASDKPREALELFSRFVRNEPL